MKQQWNRDAFIKLFKDNANEEDAGPMRAYMRNQFPFLGIRSPLRKQLIKQFLADHKMPEGEELFVEVDVIYNMPEREFQYAAMAMLERQVKQLQTTDLVFCEN